ITGSNFRDPLRLSRRSKLIGVYGGVSTLYSVRLRGGAHLLQTIISSVGSLGEWSRPRTTCTQSVRILSLATGMHMA
ncbi:hypothetical protein JI435_160400, partial [Parastagonospora nodorum SN15]